MLKPEDQGEAERGQRPQHPRQHARPPAPPRHSVRRGHRRALGCMWRTSGTATSWVVERVPVWPIAVSAALRTALRPIPCRNQRDRPYAPKGSGTTSKWSWPEVRRGLVGVPGGGVAQVQAAGAVEGFFGGADRAAAWREEALVARFG